MKANVEVTVQPGLHDLLDRADEPARAEVEPALDDFLASPGVAESKVEEEFRRATAERAETTAESLGWWDGFKAWWKGERHRVVDTEQRTLELATYWLTLPSVDGAEVSVSSSTSRSGEVSASLTIAGIGGGPTFNLDLKEQIDFDATAPERAYLTATGTFEKIEVTNLADEAIATYARLGTIDRDNFAWNLEKAQTPDLRTLGSPIETKRFNFAGASGKATKTLTVGSGTTWELGAELGLDKLGLSTKLGTKVTYEREVAYENVLPGGKAYSAKRYRSFPAYLWTVDA